MEGGGKTKVPTGYWGGDFQAGDVYTQCTTTSKDMSRSMF